MSTTNEQLGQVKGTMNEKVGEVKGNLAETSGTAHVCINAIQIFNNIIYYNTTS